MTASAALVTLPGLVIFGLWTATVAYASVAWYRRALRRDPEGTLRKVVAVKTWSAERRQELEETLATLRRLAGRD